MIWFSIAIASLVGLAVLVMAGIGFSAKQVADGKGDGIGGLVDQAKDVNNLLSAVQSQHDRITERVDNVALIVSNTLPLSNQDATENEENLRSGQQRVKE